MHKPPPPLPELNPTTKHDRIVSLDVVRGFALLGIFLMNIEGMAGTIIGTASGIDARWAGIDRLVDALIYFFVQGKFYTLFSLLFGVGFAIFLERAQASGRGGGALFARRMLVLAGFGMVHALLIWSGDVLLSYALVGFALLLFATAPVKWLWRLGIGLYLTMPAMLLAIAGVMGIAGEKGAGIIGSLDEQLRGMDEAQRAAYGHGSYLAATMQRTFDTFMTLGNLVTFGLLLLGIFLVGVALVRMGAIRDTGAHAPLFKRLLALGMAVGLPLMLLSILASPQVGNPMVPNQALASALLMLAQLPMSLAYLAAIMLAMGTAIGKRSLSWLAPVGRMALTNYLLQSLVATWIFYGYGLGWFEQLPRAWQPLFVLTVFAAQVAFSHWWLSRFRFGPAEWLWRTLTYGRLPPLRLATA